MRIEFDPTNPTEAAAVRAMLTALGPTEVRIDSPPLRMEGDKIVLNEQRIGTVKLHSEDGGVMVNLTDGTVTVASDEPNEETNPKGIDESGEPWDPRIHSTPAKTNADGTWRAKRGVTADQIAAVRAEREALTVETYVELPEDTPSEKVAEAFAELSSAPKPPAPAAPTVEAHPIGHTPTVTAPPAPIATGAPSFLDVMKAITAAQKDGKIDTAKVKELCAAVGAGESTMGLNGPDNGDKRSVFLRVVSLDPEARDALIAAAKDAPGIDTFRALLGDA